MHRFALFALLTTLSACMIARLPHEDRGGGTLPSCDFDVRMITNGPAAGAGSSRWSCMQPNSAAFEFVVFDNYTGTSSAIGAFDFVTTGCRTVLIRDRLGRQAGITNLYGSRAAGTLNFRRKASAQSLARLCL